MELCFSKCAVLVAESGIEQDTNSFIETDSANTVTATLIVSNALIVSSIQDSKIE